MRAACSIASHRAMATVCRCGCRWSLRPRRALRPRRRRCYPRRWRSIEMSAEALPRFELSASEHEMLAFAQAVTAPYAAHMGGALPFATLQEIFRKLEP